jgi:hypothetical protein
MGTSIRPDVTGREAARARRYDQLANGKRTHAQVMAQIDKEFADVDELDPATMAGSVSTGFLAGASTIANAGVRAIGDRLTGRMDDLSDAYDVRLAEETARKQAYADANPGKDAAGQLLGGLLVGGAGLARSGGRIAAAEGAGNVATRAVEAIRNLRGARGLALRGGLAGAASGALSDNDGALAEGGMGRLGGALQGGAAGAVFGGVAAPLLAKGFGALAGTSLAPRVRRIAEMATGRQDDAMRGLQSDAYGPANSKGMRLIEETLERDNVGPADLRMLAAEAGDSEMLMDMAGDNTRRLLRGSEAIPSTGAAAIRETLETRQKAQGARVVQAVTRAFGQDERPNIDTAAKWLKSQRRENAREAYAAAYGAPDAPNTISRERIAPLLEIREFREALRDGVEQYDLDRRTGEAIAELPIFRPRVAGVDAEGMPQIEIDEQVPVAVVDYLKQGLDGVINRGFKSGGMTAKKANSLKTLLRSLLRDVDEETPDYQRARAQFGGDSEMIAALDEGKDAMKRKLTLDELRAKLEDMSDGAAEQYRIGALGQLIEDARNVADGRDVMATIQRNDAMREKLQYLLPNGDGRRAVEALAKSEGRMTATRRVIQGSRTTPLAEDVKGIERKATGGVFDFLRNMRESIVNRTEEQVDRRFTGPGKNRLVDELSPILLSPRSQVPVLAESIEKRRAAAAIIADLRKRRLAGFGGAALGGLTFPE